MKLAWTCLLAAAALHAETGRDAWLRYSPLPNAPSVIATIGESQLLISARRELVRGIGKSIRVVSAVPAEDAIVIGKIADLNKQWKLSAKLTGDGFQLKRIGRYIVVAGATDRGVLYGAFALLRRMQLGQPIDAEESPYNNIRWLNHWDNLNGTIERGYGGRSIFWDNDHVRADLTRAGEYGRLLASLGINATTVTSVNADPRVLKPEYAPEIARIAAALRPWGVQTAISVDFGSPKTVGGLDTFDPLDPKVIEWWKNKMDELYRAIPDMAGIVLKADSEGRVGPSVYGRTHADAANVLARALKPHGGLLFYRGFVYDHHMDWRNLKNDRGRAAYDNFHDLDGKFDDNVIIQIKHGPIDFQVREPASPLFGALEKTNQAIELQITQEYFGQARHTVFLGPMWKAALDFDMQVGTVKALVAGKVFHRPLGGFVGVSNVGMSDSWFGNHLSQANLYAFGRLAWNPDLSSEAIIKEWTNLTFGSVPPALKTIEQIQLSSWRTYENYTGPLGLQTLTEIAGNHFGVGVENSEFNGWGQWHRADKEGVGMDRTVATGTGYIGQYRPAVAAMYESLATCPDDLLVFMHHVPYTYKLHGGKTVIQYLYDSHYEGASAVDRYVSEFKALRGHIDDQRYTEILAQLEYQDGQAEVWRDAVVNWFHRASGIPDALGRVGNYPGRYEAESMQLTGYTVQDVTPWEDAGGGKAIVCHEAKCTAAMAYPGPDGRFTLAVRYFDQNDGVSHFKAFVGATEIAAWAADDHVPSRRIDSGASSRRLIPGVVLHKGDMIRIEGVPDGKEPAALDYIEILPEAK